MVTAERAGLLRAWTILLALTGLAGCMPGTTSSAPGVLPGTVFLQAGADASTAPPAARWWRAMGDAQLSALIERGLAPARLPPSGQVDLAALIARRYVDLRAGQSELVLLAQREDLDSRSVAIAQLRFAGGTAARQAVEAAKAQLEATQAEQARVRADVAAARNELAVLTGSAPGGLDGLPGGPIPLPPAALVVGDPAGMLARRPDIRSAGHTPYRAAVLAALQEAESALGHYRAARLAAGHVLAQAAHARAVATLQDMRARAGTLAPADAVAADREALDALATEEQARAAMTRAYVALAKALGLGWEAAPAQ